MIILNEISDKISKILNGVDEETNPEQTYVPQYRFLVATQGFHLDQIFDRKTGKNMIPVFISTFGGNNNPVPELKQSDASVQMTFYFPVRFKNDFFAFADQLGEWFIGKILNYGNFTGKALCNLSLPRPGEIQDLDLKEFKKWVDSIYTQEIEVMEPYMTLDFTLYLNVYDNTNFMVGNEIKINNLTVSYKGDTILEDDSPISIERADISSSENASQQILDDNYSKGYPSNLAYTKQLPLILKRDSGYKALLNICENTKDIQNLRLSIEEEIPFDDSSLTIIHNYYITGYSRKTSLGQLFGIQLTLADVGDIE